MRSAEPLDEEAPLLLDSSSPTRGTSHTRDVHILSCAFLLIFLSYGAAQNLQSTLNSEGDLGTISLAILYLSFTFFSLVASFVVRGLGSKTALILGTSGYWLFVAANLKPSWYTMVPASIYLGFASSIMWVGQGTYLLSAAHSHAIDCKLHEGAAIGKFNGEFWGVYASHQLVGNLISLFLLRNEKEGSTSGTTLLFTVFLCIMTIGTILICYLNRKERKKEAGPLDLPASLYSHVVSISRSLVTPLSDKRMLLIIPLMSYAGLQRAFVWVEFTKYIVNPMLGESGVGGAMAVYGAFDALCSLFAGRLTSSLSTITLIVPAGVLIQVVVLLWLLLAYSVTSGVLGMVYPLLMAVMLGIGDGVLNTQLYALLGMLFKHDMEGAFAQLKFWQSASITAMLFLSPYITLQVVLVIMVIVLSVSVAAFLFLTLQVEKAFSVSNS